MRMPQLGAGWTKRPRPLLRARSAARQGCPGPLLTQPLSLLAGFGLLMAAVPSSVVLTVLVASAVFAMLLDAIKRPLFARFEIA